ncbi:MAG: tyrosine-type recombinase/integrase, partial [Candidatus Lokiarchaeota archaeon]|nr:tyrosine-type recombinase/integrase [Candidatus Lokiarchaeota archaeon]
MSNFKFSDFLEDFLIAKEIEEGCRPSTVKAYRYDLLKFIKIVGDLELESPLLRQKIRLFLKRLKDKNYTKKGIARKIATLRSFFKFLTLNEFISKNPMSQIRSPKINLHESLPKFLNLSDVKLIFEKLKNRKLFNTKKSQRYYLLVRLLYATMARVSEACNIKIKDINFENGYIKLRGKGNKQRIVPVDNATLKLIKQELINRLVYKEDDYLLINTRNEKLTPRVVQNDIKRIKKKCGFADSKVITPHVFRHTGATHLRRSGMDISELQDILGHSSPNTTRIYAKNDISQLKQSYNSMHPLNTS